MAKTLRERYREVLVLRHHLEVAIGVNQHLRVVWACAAIVDFDKKEKPYA